MNVVIGDQSSDIPGAIEKAVEDRLGDVVSVSFGLCERKATAETEFFDVWYAIGNVGRMGGEDRRLGARRIIFGKIGDRLEQLAAARIVEIPAGQRLW